MSCQAPPVKERSWVISLFISPHQPERVDHLHQAQAKSPLAFHGEKTTRSPHSLKIAVGHNGEVMKRHTECSYDQHRPR